MLRTLAVAALFLCLALGAAPCCADEALGIRVPEGFEVSLFADDALAHDIYSMTIDSLGRVVVAGPGYVKILIDSDDDGRADTATLFSSAPASGAHSLLFDGRDLICTGDNSVARFADADGDDRADGPPHVWTNLRHPEHGANGLARGPDGWFYLICGNEAGVLAEHARAATSPVKSPECGALVRFSPDGQTSEVVAHGFRNPYDLDFNAAGHVFTVDSDNEREHALPWYAPTRLFDIAQGMEHGWLLSGWQRSWNRPASFFDNVDRLCEIGRGSPTGLTVYRHRQFPERYRGGVFTACWTFGRVYHIPLAAHGATYRGEKETFLETTGDVGFAPVDLAVGAEGDLFIAVGGRGTRGSVFRVRHESGVPDAIDGRPPLEQVLAADQPLASWSRATWAPAAEALGAAAFEAVLTSDDHDVPSQVRAVEVLVEIFGSLRPAIARQAIALDRPHLSARVAWALGRQGSMSMAAARSVDDAAALQTQNLLVSLSYRAHPRVARAAWEAIGGLPSLDVEKLRRPPNWSAALATPVRRVRAAAIAAACGAARSSYEAHRRAVDLATTAPRERLAHLWIDTDFGNHERAADEHLDACIGIFRSVDDARIRLEAVRLMQVCLGDMRIEPGQLELYSGYSVNKIERLSHGVRQAVVDELSREFPSHDAALDYELARLLAAIHADASHLVERVAVFLSEQSAYQDDLHYLIVLARIPGDRASAVTLATAHALTKIHDKMTAAAAFPDRNWPLRVGELFDELAARDPKLAEAVVGDPAFGLPAHTLFAAPMPRALRQTAARRLIAAVADAEPGEGWTEALVRLAADLPDEESLPILRSQWSDYGLRDAIALVLARRRLADDHARLVEALGSPQANVVRAVAEALVEQSAKATPSDLAAAIKALRQACLVGEDRNTRQALFQLLHHWTGQTFAIADERAPIGDVSAAYAPVFDWFAAAHPDAAAALSGFSGADAAEWKSRLAGIEWSAGDATRGKAVYEKRACHRCHTGGGKLGPSLAGAASRFERDDLFAAIVDPSKDVAPLYQTRLLATRGGQIYVGLVVYESAEGTLLQTSPDTTVRVGGGDLLAVRTSAQSIMPMGLLNDATDQELADLYAHLRTITND